MIPVTSRHIYQSNTLLVAGLFRVTNRVALMTAFCFLFLMIHLHTSGLIFTKCID